MAGRPLSDPQSLNVGSESEVRSMMSGVAISFVFSCFRNGGLTLFLPFSAPELAGGVSLGEDPKKSLQR